MSSTEAQIFEIFSSIQGEGIYIGDRHIFIRFSGCNLACEYCDTDARLLTSVCKIEEIPGSHHFTNYNNPLTSAKLIEFINVLDKGKNIHSAICLTGGEPLLQVDFLKGFLKDIAHLNFLSYLETNGTLPDRLQEIIENIDIVALDIKLPSATGLSSYLIESAKSLKIAKSKEVFVKVIFSKETPGIEIIEAAKLVANIDDKIPFVLQPVTPYGVVKHRPNPEEILSFQAIASKYLKNVKVIPQAHKIMSLN